jgi:hypothetical protein
MEKQNLPYQNQTKKSIAIVSPVDENGNLIGESIEVYSNASIVLGELRGEAVTNGNRRIQVYTLKICTEAGCRELQGVYGGPEFNLEDTIFIVPGREVVEIGYGVFGKPVISRPTRRSAWIMEDKKKRFPLGYTTVALGEEVVIYVEETYREIGRLPDGTPVVDENVGLRIRARPPPLEKLGKQLYTISELERLGKQLIEELKKEATRSDFKSD